MDNKKDKNKIHLKAGPNSKDRKDIYNIATLPEKGQDDPDTMADLMAMTPKDYVVYHDDEMEQQFWVARMLCEMHTVFEIVEIAKRQNRKGVTQQLVSSIRDHAIWKKAIEKARVEFLINSFTEIPLANTIVRIRELSELYYKLMGKYPVMKYKIDSDGTPIETGEQIGDDMHTFDNETADIEITIGGRDGYKTKISKKKYYDTAIKILDQIRVELDKADLSTTSEAQYIRIIRDCGFESYEV